MTAAEFRDATVVALLPNIGGIILSAFVGWSMGNFVLAYVVTILLVGIFLMLQNSRLIRQQETELEEE